MPFPFWPAAIYSRIPDIFSPMTTKLGLYYIFLPLAELLLLLEKEVLEHSLTHLWALQATLTYNDQL